MEISISHHLGFYEAALEIGVDCASGLGCQTAFWDGPAADLFLASWADVLEGVGDRG